MPQKREKRIPLLLAGLLLLGGCTAPTAESPMPTPKPTPTATEIPVPTPTPSPALPTVAMERPDLTGEWHRTDCHSGHQATLTISEQTEESFLVEADCWYYTHSGVWQATPARFVGENVALVEEYGYDFEEEEEKPPVKFVWDGDTLTVETEAWYQLGFGFNVTISGTYVREKPKYTNAGALERSLTAKQQMLLQELGEELQWDILYGISDGCPSDPLPCLLSDGRQGTQLEIYFPTLSYYNWSLIFTKDGKVYGQNNPNFYTNDPSATEMPEVVWPLQDETHDCFTVPTGGKLGTVLVTVDRNFEDGLHLQIYTSDDIVEPIQTIVVEDGMFNWSHVVDANFDGHKDFGIMYIMGASNTYWHYWLWNEENSQFEEEMALAELCEPFFDAETQIISCYINYSVASGVQTYWHWVDEEVTLIRRIETHYPEWDKENTTQLLTVEDNINGELVEVYRETFGDPNNGEIYEEAARWCDLNYHGEDMETLWGFPIDDTHDAFEVPTGGKLGTVLVTMEENRGNTPPIGSVMLSVWNSSDLSAPIQTIALENCWVLHDSWNDWNDVADANFDGYMDFGIECVRGAAAGSYWGYRLWNEEEGRFEEEPAIDEQEVYFDAGREVIYSRWSHFDPVAGGVSYYRWEEGELAAIRTISRDGPIYCGEDKGLQGILTVEDNINGVLTEVFQIETDVNIVLKEAEKWRDLNYHGE